MKSSFSWPGRPPAEMISRNVNRLLTSILDGSQKRGTFCTSILDGTPKRGAFCTSILDGTPKRGAFYTSILDGTPKRGAFCTSILDGTPKRGAFYTSILGGSPKRGAFYTSILDGTPKRGAFCTSTLDGTLKRGAFFGRQGRGVSNTPSKRSRMGTRVAKGSQASDSLSPAGPFDGAYLGTPYHATSKRDAFCTSYLVGTLKRGTFCTSYLVATLKRGAFCTSYLVATLKRGAFCTSYLVATPKRAAFYTSYLVATPKRAAFFGRKGRGVSNTPSKRSRMGTRVAKGSQTSDSLSPTGPFDGAYAIRPYDETSKSDAFASSFSIVVFSSFIFLCLSSLFSSGRSSFRCSEMCAP